MPATAFRPATAEERQQPEYRLGILRTKLQIAESRAQHCKGAAKASAQQQIPALRERIRAVEDEAAA